MNKINEVESFLGLDETRFYDDYYCVLAGQVSSGKSKFMNLLLGDEYLPVGTREMTAVPTYIKNGDDSVLLYKDMNNSTIPISCVKDIKKGNCDFERIEISISTLSAPREMVFVDTPGINSVSYDNYGIEFEKADVFLYFLAKHISAFDVEILDKIIRKKGIELIIIRTRIDDIKHSEENIYETFEEENMMIKSLYPDSKFFFVSLVDNECKLNQLPELMGYVNNHMFRDLEKSRKAYLQNYIHKILLPELNNVKKCIESTSTNKYKNNLIRKAKKQIKVINRNIKDSEESLLSHMMTGQKNYYKSGCIFIENYINSKGFISCKEIQDYILNSMRKIELWYELEVEDIIAGISPNCNSKNIKPLVSDDWVFKIFDKYGQKRTRLFDYSIIEQDYIEKRDEYYDLANASAYLKKLLDKIYVYISDSFSELYTNQFDSIIADLKNQYINEEELIQKYISSESDYIDKINSYITYLMGVDGFEE